MDRDLEFTLRVYDEIFSARLPQLGSAAFSSLKASNILNLFNFVEWGSTNGLDGGK